MIRRPPRSTRVRSSAASDVYKRQLAGLLDVCAGLVGLAFGFEALVVGHLSGGFLDLALGLLDGVLGLVGEAHESAFLLVGFLWSGRVMAPTECPQGCLSISPPRGGVSAVVGGCRLVNMER